MTYGEVRSLPIFEFYKTTLTVTDPKAISYVDGPLVEVGPVEVPEGSGEGYLFRNPAALPVKWVFIFSYLNPRFQYLLTSLRGGEKVEVVRYPSMGGSPIEVVLAEA